MTCGRSLGVVILTQRASSPAARFSKLQRHFTPGSRRHLPARRDRLQHLDLLVRILGPCRGQKRRLVVVQAEIFSGSQGRLRQGGDCLSAANLFAGHPKVARRLAMAAFMAVTPSVVSSTFILCKLPSLKIRLPLPLRELRIFRDLLRPLGDRQLGPMQVLADRP